jgi:DNA (cytosine-5)-methyltransferase 1
MQPKINAVDLFCGAGGLTHGLQRGGINVLAGVDVDPVCEYPYSANNTAKFILKSISNLSGEEITPLFPQGEYTLLAGCAPCQAFSSYTQAKKIQLNEKWSLIRHFMRLIDEINPHFVTMENVSNLTKEHIFCEFISALENNKYYVWHRIVNCSQYGVPQKRQRLVLIASKIKHTKLLACYQSTPMTVHDAIGKLPKLAAGDVSPHDSLHRTSKLSPLNLKRIQASKPGRTWRDWPTELIATCHRNDSGKTYPGVYGRMEWNDVCPTITTQFFGFGNGRFGHPEQDRALSLREGAILQTFPPSYSFVQPGSKVSMKTMGRLIGNAVPVNLGEAIAKSILNSLTPN